MNNDVTSHPGPGDLLLYADGELEREASAHIAAHLGECQACSAWLTELQDGAEEYSQRWHPELKQASASPPAPWFDVRQKMSELDRKPARIWRPARWAAAAAAILIGITIGQWPFEQKASAAELLRKASDRALTVSTPRRPIRITTKVGSVVRPAVWSGSTQARLARDAQDRTTSLRTLFESANFDWQDPLSARSFSEWRESLPARREEVTRVGESGQVSAYEIRTSTDSGSLAEASLTLRASDLHPVRETLRFRNGEWVQITEELNEGLPAPPAPPLIAGEPATPPEGPVTVGEELRVWAALHRAGADLGEPVEVQRVPERNAIVVTVLGLSGERRRVLEQALNGIPRVEIQFSDPKPVREPSKLASDETPDRPPALQSKLEAQLGGRTMAENFTNRLLEASESSLARAHAIRKLADRFPPDVEQTLTPADRDILTSIVSEHFQALEAASRQVITAVRQFSPAASQSTPSQSAAASARGWQLQSKGLLETSQRIDALLTQLLAVPGSTENDSLLLQQLDEALARWQAGIAVQ